MPDPSDIEAVLAERARLLARAPVAEDAEEGGFDLVVLRTGDERFGLALEAVRESDRIGVLAELPGTPPAWRGLVNLRGTLHPVLDLRAAFGGAPTPDADTLRVCTVAAGDVVAA